MPIIEPEFMELTGQLDVPVFWTENQRCEGFTTQKPRCAAAFSPDDLPPFLLRNGSPGEIKTRIRDDFQKAGQTGGLKVTAAGSLAAGTGVGRMRWMMQVGQDHCRYD